METQRKPLRTQEEIFDAYPEHRKFNEAKDKYGPAFVEHVHGLMQKLQSEHNLVLCHRADAEELLSVSHELFGDKEGADEYVGTLFTSSNAQPWTNALQKLIYEYMGINHDKFMAEKDDMIEQLRMAQAPQ